MQPGDGSGLVPADLLNLAIVAHTVGHSLLLGQGGIGLSGAGGFRRRRGQGRGAQQGAADQQGG